MYDQLWDAVRETSDDPFLDFDIAKAKQLAHTEVAAYEMLSERLTPSQQAFVSDRLPYLRNRKPLRQVHCSCNDETLLVWDDDEGICTACGTARAYMVNNIEKLPYGEMRDFPKKYARSNRFRVIMGRFMQGAMARVNEKTLDTIRSYLKVSPDVATATDVRRALRKGKLGELYPSVPGIVAQLRQTGGLHLDPYDVDTLKSMFVAVDQYMPKSGRTYMPSYNMILCCLMEHLGYEDVAVYVPLLSHRRTHARVAKLCAEAMEMVRIA